MNNNHLSQTTYRAGILQSRAYRALTAFMNSRLKAYALSTPEWAYLGSLYERGTLQPSELAEQIGIKPPVASKLTKTLVAKHLIVVSPRKGDGRTLNVKLSAQGEQLAQKIEHELRIAMRAWLKDIDPKQLAVYLAVMEQIADLA
jgi:DNA-binding MarR family transcriptional regulator